MSAAAPWPRTSTATALPAEQHWAFQPVRKVNPPPDPTGWAKLGRPSWSSLRIGLTDPRTSTAGVAMALTMLDPTASGTVSDAQMLTFLKLTVGVFAAAFIALMSFFYDPRDAKGFSSRLGLHVGALFGVLINMRTADTVIGDTVKERNETFTVHLSNPVNAPITKARGRGTILNDDR